MRVTISRYLDLATNVSVIIVALWLTASAVTSYRQKRVEVSVSRPELHIGGLMKAIPGVEFSKNRTTLLVFLHSKCTACLNSVPDYNEIYQAAKATGSPVSVVGVFGPEDPVDIKSLGLLIPTASGVDFKGLGVDATPTVALVDHKGNLKDVWVGRLFPNAKSRILKELTEKRI